MKILFLTTILPRLQRMGSEVASQCFISALEVAGHDVIVMGYQRPDDMFDLTVSEISVGSRYIETRKAKLYPILWMILSLLKGLPYSSAKYYSHNYVELVKKTLGSIDYDYIIIDHPQLAWLETYIADKSKLIATSHNVENELYFDTTKKARNFLERWIYTREAIHIRKLEHRLAVVAQQVWTLTHHDAQYFLQQPHRASIRPFDLPPGLAPSIVSSSPKEFDIGIIGSWGWKPNIEGLSWFLENIYPKLPSDFSVHIAGRGAEKLIRKYPKIQYRGFVPNAQEFMVQARVIAIPTLTGGGIQIKTLDAIASGSLIVATPIALRGISTIPSTVKIAIEAEEFSQCLISAISSKTILSNPSDATEWFENRKKRFLNDVQQAILSS